MFAHPHLTKAYVPYNELPHGDKQRLPKSRAAKLKRMADREEHRWRYDRVKTYIQQRIDNALGTSKGHGPAAQTLIDETIDKIVEDSRFVFKGKRLISTGSKDLLAALEKDLVRKLHATLVGDASAGRRQPQPRVPALDTSAAPGSQQEPMVEPGVLPSVNRPPKSAQLPLDKIDTWQLIDAYQNYSTAEKLRQEKLQERQRKAMYREELKRQMQEHEEARRRELEESRVVKQQSERFHEAWKREQQSLKEAIDRHHEEEKVKRIEVMQERRKQLQQAKEEQLALERAQIEKCQQMIREEQERARLAKIAERKRQEAIEEENKKEKARRAKVAEAEAKEDLRLMEEYKRKLEKEESERKSAFSMRMAKMQAAGQKWATEGAGKKLQDFLRQQEQQILEAAMKKEKDDEERERRDKLKRKNDSKKMMEENMKTSQLREQEAKQAQEQALRDIERYKREQAEDKAREIESRMKARARQRQYLEALKKQAEESKKTRVAPDVSEKEKLLNRHLLEQAAEDPSFVTFVSHKLLPSLEGSARRKSLVAGAVPPVDQRK